MAAKMTGEKPTMVFLLVLIGGILVTLAGLAIIFAIYFIANLGGWVAGLGSIGVSIAVVAGIMMIISAVMLNTADKSKIRTWSIVALVFSIVSLVGTGGLGLGFLLGLIGSILGLTYKGK
ncbi:MAG TPA: DUF6114 domain-containing protein [Candidatus Saccharimonadales bacterium]|nr:DUF6114 domain-containing protein [Candidatus Saccharimonadales bacterium]